MVTLLGSRPMARDEGRLLVKAGPFKLAVGVLPIQLSVGPVLLAVLVRGV